MTTTTTYYVYDKSGRMTTQWSIDSVNATYFVYNQRDMVTQFYPTSGYANRYFTYNGVGERVVVVDGGSPNYWTYDGYKLLTEKDNGGNLVRRYRHNQTQQEKLGSEVEVKSGNIEFGTAYPVRNQGGDLDELLYGATDILWMNVFGDVGASSLAFGDRLQQTPETGLLALTTTTRLLATIGGGVFSPDTGTVFGGPASLRDAFGLLAASLVLDCGGQGLRVVLQHGKKPPVACGVDVTADTCSPDTIDVKGEGDVKNPSLKEDWNKNIEEAKKVIGNDKYTKPQQDEAETAKKNAEAALKLGQYTVNGKKIMKYQFEVEITLKAGSKYKKCWFGQYLRGLHTIGGNKKKIGDPPGAADEYKIDGDFYETHGLDQLKAAGVARDDYHREGGFDLDGVYGGEKQFPPTESSKSFWADGDGGPVHYNDPPGGEKYVAGDSIDFTFEIVARGTAENDEISKRCYLKGAWENKAGSEPKIDPIKCDATKKKPA